jgi:hypothetical protein
MTRKTHTKAISAAAEPAVAMTRSNTRSPEFFSIYANDIQVQVSPWDMRFILGEVTDPIETAEHVVTIRQLAELRISPQLAKSLSVILIDQLRKYEENFGQIPGPRTD